MDKVACPTEWDERTRESNRCPFQHAWLMRTFESRSHRSSSASAAPTPASTWAPARQTDAEDGPKAPAAQRAALGYPSVMPTASAGPAASSSPFGSAADLGAPCGPASLRACRGEAPSGCRLFG